MICLGSQEYSCVLGISLIIGYKYRSYCCYEYNFIIITPCLDDSAASSYIYSNVLAPQI